MKSKHEVSIWLELMKAPFLILGLAGLVISFTSLPCLANAEQQQQTPEDLAELSLEQLMDIEVTSVSKKKQKLSETAAAVYVISNEDIRRSTATSVPELLRQVPGLHVARIDSSKWAISARGFNGRYANKLLVLVDGRSVYTPLFSGVYWEIQDQLLEDIERIEVIRGPGASLWGSNAVNGVINIITKSAADSQGGLVTAGVGTEMRGVAGGRYGVALGDKAHLRVTGKYLNRSDSVRLNGERASDQSAEALGSFRLDWSNSGNDFFTVQGDAYDWEGDTTIHNIYLVPPYSQIVDDLYTNSGGNILTRWTHKLSSGSELDFQFYYDHINTDLAGLGEKRNTIDFDFQHRFWLGTSNEFVWGAGYRHARDQIQNGDLYLFDPLRRRDHLMNFFVQDEIRVIPERLNLTIGSKFEYLVFSYGDQSTEYKKFSVQPNVRFLWNVNDGNVFWGAVSKAVRNPSRADHDVRVNWMVLPPGIPQNPGMLPIQFSIFGSQLFDPESLLAYEAGYRTQITSQLSLDLAGFYNSYRDLRGGQFGKPFFESLPTPHLTVPNWIVNQYDGRAYGLEASARWWVTPRWSTRFAYSFLEPDFDDGLIPSPQIDPLLAETLRAVALGDSPPHQVFAGSSWNLNGAFGADVEFRWIDEFSDIENYAELNARFAWRFAESAELSIVGQNLLNQYHREFRQELMEVPTQVERSIYTKLVWEF
jgi:iron complex outermembrane receptor protein